MIRRSFKKRLKLWIYRKTDNFVRSNSHRRFLKNAIIMICLISAAILAVLIYLESQ